MPPRLRFPHENSYEDFPLPQNELPMFCFPRGVNLKVRGMSPHGPVTEVTRVTAPYHPSPPDHCPPPFPPPCHMSAQHDKKDNAPMPSYFSFVFTSIDGDRVHVACLQFYEILPVSTLRALEVPTTKTSTYTDSVHMGHRAYV